VAPRPQTYVLKLARSGEDGEKVYLLLESGSRFHTTKVNQLKGLNGAPIRSQCIRPAAAASTRFPRARPPRPQPALLRTSLASQPATSARPHPPRNALPATRPTPLQPPTR
jgi:hypothetical protein